MLTDSQIKAFDKFSKLKVGALFMKMGTGKTRVALELVKYNNVDLLIYVVPFSVKDNIQKEIDKWGVNCDYIIIGYETIQASDNKYMQLLQDMEGKKCFIIADESIFIKNDLTKRYLRMISIRKKCEYALILNGTPITKNEYDIYNQMEFLSSKIMKMTRSEFQNIFYKKISYKKKGQAPKTFYKFSEVNSKLLHKIISPYIFECDLEFEHEQKFKNIYVDYKEDNEYYREKERKLKEYIEYGYSDIIINMLNNLNKIASCYKPKLDKVIEYAKGKRIIVFCNYLDEVEYLSKHMDCYVIIGSTRQRDDVIKKFENDNVPLVMTFGVGSYSLNLQFCDEIVYSSINFDYGKLEQSEYRIKRLGQDSDIKYTYILTDLGINKMIFDNLSKKSTLQNLIKEKMMKGDVVEWLKDI